MKPGPWKATSRTGNTLAVGWYVERDNAGVTEWMTSRSGRPKRFRSRAAANEAIAEAKAADPTSSVQRCTETPPMV